MTISEIIETLENSQEEIENHKQIPNSVQLNIITHINEALELLNDCADEYGEDSDIGDGIDGDEDSDEW